MNAIDIAATMVAQALAQAVDRLAIVGIAGAQGSGKSTLAIAIKNRMDAEHVPTALLSIDDLYLTKAERVALARDVHPLLRTRGVPGTHDVSLGLSLIAALDRGEAVALPRFDKGTDDRLPSARWDRAPAGTRLLLLEGWCVGARPQRADALNTPINALEREEDAGAAMSTRRWQVRIRGFSTESTASSFWLRRIFRWSGAGAANRSRRYARSGGAWMTQP
jgi:D-glycerate 3-kinase